MANKKRREKQSEATAVAEPWALHDKLATPRLVFNLRLNEHYMTMLDWLAEQRGCSKHRICMEILKPAFEQLASQAEKKGKASDDKR